jgi:hypothetical protein
MILSLTWLSEHWLWREPRSSIQFIEGLSNLYESHRSRVHAVAQTGGTGTVIEDVAKMSVTLTARNSSALHPQAHIAYLNDVLLRNGLPETRPTRARFKFGLRAENSVIATYATVNAVVVVIPGAAGIGALRTRTPGHFE